MSLKRNNNEIIKELSELYPKLNFNKFEYKGTHDPSTVICPIHGEFKSSYNNLKTSVAKIGCRKCSTNYNKLTHEEAILNLKNRFPEYDYSKFVYTKSLNKSTVICSKHGEVEISYNNAMNRTPCPKCGIEKGRLNKKENFSKSRNIIKELEEMYPNLDFSKFIYTKSSVKSTAICPSHGEFQARFNDLSSLFKNNKDSKGCPECYKSKINEHILNLKNKYSKYDFSKFEYKGHKKPVTIICSKHGEFDIKYSSFYLTDRKSELCPKCNDPIYKLQEKFPNLDFSKFEYKNHKSKSIIICPEHGEFINSYDNLYFKSKYGCPNCCKGKQFSTYEKEIIEYIKLFYDGCIEENNRNVIYNDKSKSFMELDIYLPDIKFAIEFNGEYFHSDEKIMKRSKYFNSADEYHNFKTNKCNDQGIKLIHINEEDYIKNKNEILNNIKQDILSL